MTPRAGVSEGIVRVLAPAGITRRARHRADYSSPPSCCRPGGLLHVCLTSVLPSRHPTLVLLPLIGHTRT